MESGSQTSVPASRGELLRPHGAPREGRETEDEQDGRLRELDAERLLAEERISDLEARLREAQEESRQNARELAEALGASSGYQTPSAGSGTELRCSTPAITPGPSLPYPSPGPPASPRRAAREAQVSPSSRSPGGHSLAPLRLRPD